LIKKMKKKLRLTKPKK